MREQEKIERINKRPFSKTKSKSEMSLVDSVSSGLFQKALELLKSEHVQNIQLNSSGVLTGQVGGVVQKEVSVQVTAQGGVQCRKEFLLESTALVLAF